MWVGQSSMRAYCVGGAIIYEGLLCGWGNHLWGLIVWVGQSSIGAYCVGGAIIYGGFLCGWGNHL